MFQIAKGSKEYIIVDVADATGVTTDLTGSSPAFEVELDDDHSSIQTGTPAVTGMRLQCLVDTTVGTWDPGLYDLYVEFTVGSEEVRLLADQFYVFE